MLCIAALLPSPSRALLLPGSAINPLAGGWGEKGDKLFPTLYSAWSCFCVSLELPGVGLPQRGSQLLHTELRAMLMLQHQAPLGDAVLTAPATPERAVVGKEDAKEKEGGWLLPQQLECGFRSIPPSTQHLS